MTDKKGAGRTPAVYVHEHVAAVVAMYDGLIDEAAWMRPLVEQLEALATRLLASQRSASLAARVELTNWHPDLIGAADDEIFAAELGIDDTRLAIARQHGFPAWKPVAEVGDRLPDPRFEGAVEALLGGDLDTLETALRAHEDLVGARSHYGHRATLLHYVGANGVETYRQRVPANAADVARLLIERGADPASGASMYGGEVTALQLVTSSAHPAAAGVTADVVAALRPHWSDG